LPQPGAASFLMIDDALLPFNLPAVGGKKVTAAFDVGRITADGGVLLLTVGKRRLRLADRLARVIADRRDPVRITHTPADILHARMLAIARGYEDADDLYHLPGDPGFKQACGRLPDTGSRPLLAADGLTLGKCAQPARGGSPEGVMVDVYRASYATPPAGVTLDLDDTVDVVHGHQQLCQFNPHYYERCFLPSQCHVPIPETWSPASG
jgi:hypothetical protein